MNQERYYCNSDFYQSDLNSPLCNGKQPYQLYFVADGHGPSGQQVAAHIQAEYPKVLLRQLTSAMTKFSDIEHGLRVPSLSPTRMHADEIDQMIEEEESRAESMTRGVSISTSYTGVNTSQISQVY